MSIAYDVETYPLGPLEQIPVGEGRSFRVAGVEVAVFRTRAGEVFATQGRCPHRGAPLADGLIGGGKVICPFHSYAFALETGEPVRNACEALRTYPVEVDADGALLLRLDARGG